MICEAEAKEDLAQSGVGVDTVEPLRPTWDPASRIYSCDYVYAGGATMTLSVKDASSVAAATAYFDSLARRLRKAETLNGTGNAAYTTIGGDMVVHEDSKVLLVDVSKLPARFGNPAQMPRRRCDQCRGDNHGMLGIERCDRVTGRFLHSGSTPACDTRGVRRRAICPCA